MINNSPILEIKEKLLNSKFCVKNRVCFDNKETESKISTKAS